MKGIALRQPGRRIVRWPKRHAHFAEKMLFADAATAVIATVLAYRPAHRGPRLECSLLPEAVAAETCH